MVYHLHPLIRVFLISYELNYHHDLVLIVLDAHFWSCHYLVWVFVGRVGLASKFCTFIVIYNCYYKSSYYIIDQN